MLKQNGWRGFPSGDEKPAMEISLPKNEMERRYGLQFVTTGEGPATEHSTYFNDEKLGSVTICYYERIPHGRAIVFVDSGLELKVVVPRLLDVFGLDPSLVNVPRDLG